MSSETAKKFPSNYAPGLLHDAANYLAELMCSRQAKKRKQDLPLRFWNLPAWQKEYRLQLIAAQSLMKLYSVAAVGAALRRPECKTVHSLRAPWLDDVVKREQIRMDREKELRAAATPEEPTTTFPSPTSRPVFVPKKSIRTLLRDI